MGTTFIRHSDFVIRHDITTVTHYSFLPDFRMVGS